MCKNDIWVKWQLFNGKQSKLFRIESFAFVLTTEMEESSALSYTKIYRLVIRE